jgi:hypothetical protein
MRNSGRAIAAALAIAAIACANDTTSPSSTTTETTTVTQSELFTGSLSPRESSFYSFTTTTAGTVAITLASVTVSRPGPPTDVQMELGIGQPAGTGCALTSSLNASAGLVAQLTSPVETGIYCVNVSDPGTLTAPVSFAVRIAHP